MKTDVEILEVLKALPTTETNLDRRLHHDKVLISSVLHAWNFTVNVRCSKYLDVGCNYGTVTEALGGLLYLEKEDVFGIDISTPSRLVLDQKNFRVYDGRNIPFADDEFDFVSIFQVLHHVHSRDLHPLLENIRRVIQTGGYLMIKEHNCNSVETCQLIDLEHLFYGISRDSFENPGNYRSDQEWDKIFAEYDFKPIKSFSAEREPTNSYFRLFVSEK